MRGIHTTQDGRSTRRRGGMTLIELLVVIVILGVLSGMTVSMTNNLEQQSRYDRTAASLAEIRTATLGPDTVATNGHLLAGGFLQDVGWLPHEVNDLVQRPEAEAVGDPEIGIHQYSETWKTAYGWHGPYLAAQQARKDETLTDRIYDGWGNDYTGLAICAESGVTYPPTWKQCPDFTDAAWTADYAIRSIGSDNKEEATDDLYARSFPDADQSLIRAADWQTDLADGGLQVTLINHTTHDLTSKQARLRILIPQWDKSEPLGFSLASETDRFASDTFLLGLEAYASVSDPEGPRPYKRVVTSSDIFAELLVPNGRRMLFLVGTDGQPLTYNDGSGDVVLDASVELNLSRKIATPVCVTLYIRENDD